MTNTRETPTTDGNPDFVKQALPFNEFRFEDCMAHLSAVHGRELSVYEMMKLHVMIDVFHTISRGKPVIGGPFWPFENGPVSRDAKHYVEDWVRSFEEKGATPEMFDAAEKEAGRICFKARSAPDPDEFSKSELDAMEKAWDTVIPLLADFKKSQEYFHRDSAVGRAWSRAKKAGRELNWNDIIDEFAQETGRNLSHIKTIVQF